MIKVGIWGCGGISPFHRRAYQALQEKGVDVKVVALCDINPESFNTEKKINISGGEAKPLPKVDHCYTDADEMFEKEELDMVDICLPVFLHKDCAIKALKNNVNVLVEKPMALTYQDCKEMIEAEKNSKARMMVAHCVRFEQPSQFLKAIIDEKKYGEMISADFSRISPLPLWRFQKGKEYTKRHDGVILDMQLHDIDLVNYLFGEPEEVYSVSQKAFTYCDSVSTIFKYKNGIVNIRGDWGFPQSYSFASNWRVNFEKAAVECDRNGVVTVYDDEKSEIVLNSSADSFEEEIRYFVEMLLNNSENTKNPSKGTLKSIELVEKIESLCK